MIVVEESTSSEDSLSFERHPALRRLEGGQRRSAELMMDSKTRVVAQQAPPGSGKTYTLAAIVAAVMENPGTKVLCLAPLNVAVVKMCEELVSALKTEGNDEVPLALFSGTGKAKYRDHLDKKHELTSYSATNSGQTRTVMEILEGLDNFPGRFASFPCTPVKRHKLEPSWKSVVSNPKLHQ
ncbi:hypothetical protein niasHS_009042 [Heterodera schachtii]|uniref:Helicase ATP-binding domain-containing protein n=1 Tax=Heterodera schachtii TaxID=97005 RepID=A0ABD2J598_HETSC